MPNLNNVTAAAALANGGTPFTTSQFRFKAPSGAQCHSATSLRCTATAQSALTYGNYQFSPLDNLSIGTEYYSDMQGQRTGVATEYYETAIELQHWLFPQIELRPELAYYHSGKNAFNGNSNLGIAPNRDYSVIASGDIIVHF